MPSRLPGLVRLVVRARRGVPSTRRARSFYEVIAASLPFDVLPGVNAGDSSCAAHAALRWVPASPASATPTGGLTSPPQAFNLSARPAPRMVLAAYPALNTAACAAQLPVNHMVRRPRPPSLDGDACGRGGTTPIPGGSSPARPVRGGS